MIIDTNIFIDFLKGSLSAKKFFEKEKRLSTSILCVMGIIAGFSKKEEIKKFEAFLEKGQIRVYPIEREISKIAYQLFIKYHHSYGQRIPDSLIAATCLFYKEPLATLNTKDFRFIKEITLIKPY